MNDQELVNQIRSIARCACCKYVLTPDQWEEVYQDTALAYWKSKSTTRAWGAAKDSARTQLYGKSRIRKYQPKFIEFNPGWMDQQVYKELESDIEFESLLNTLNKREREAIIKMYLEDKSYTQTFKEMGIVDSSLFRIRKNALEKIKKARIN